MRRVKMNLLLFGLSLLLIAAAVLPLFGVKTYATISPVVEDPHRMITLTQDDARPHDDKPAITFLNPGFGSTAGAFSNDNVSEDLYWDENSIIPQLEKKFGGGYVYLAHHDGSIYTLKRLKNNNYNDQTDIGDKLDRVDKHIFVYFETENSDDTHQVVYDQFDEVVDDVCLQYLQLTGKIPKINLVSHSRGGIINMMYAIRHPYNVFSMFSLGAPYNGSVLGEFPELLKMGVGNPNAPGVLDIMNDSLNESLRNDWNAVLKKPGVDIKAHFLGSMTSLSMIETLLEDPQVAEMEEIKNARGIIDFVVNFAKEYPLDTVLLTNIIKGKISGLMLLALAADYDVSSLEGPENIKKICDLVVMIDGRIVLLDDLFLNLTSQLGSGYDGAELYYKIMGPEEANNNSRSIPDEPAVGHNLEARDPDFVKYIVDYMEYKNPELPSEQVNLNFGDLEVRSSDGVGFHNLEVISDTERYYRMTPEADSTPANQIKAYLRDAGGELQEVDLSQPFLFEANKPCQLLFYNYGYVTGEKFRIKFSFEAPDLNLSTHETDHSQNIAVNGGETQCFRFQSTETDLYEFLLSNQADFQIKFYDSALSDLNLSYRTGNNKTVLGAGRYYVGVKNLTNQRKNVNLTAKRSDSLIWNTLSEDTVYSREHNYYRFIPDYSGIYSFQLTGEQNRPGQYLTSRIYTRDMSIAGSVTTPGQRTVLSVRLNGGETYFLQAVNDNAEAVNYQYSIDFKPQQIYLKENPVLLTARDSAFLFLPNEDGVYRFGLSSGYDNPRIYNENLLFINGQESNSDGARIFLQKGKKYYILAKDNNATESSTHLVVGIKAAELDLNQERTVELSDGTGYGWFTPTQSGLYSFELGGETAFSSYVLYDENLNYLNSHAGRRVTGVLDEGKTYYIGISGGAESYSVHSRFSPTEITVNSFPTIMGEHWYTFKAPSTESFNFYTYGDGGLSTKIILHRKDLGAVVAQTQTTAGHCSLQAPMTAEETYYIQILCTQGSGAFIFGLEYTDPSLHQEDENTYIVTSEGEMVSPYFIGNGEKQIKFVPSQTGYYELRILKNFANNITTVYNLIGNSSFALTLNGALSTSTVQFYNAVYLTANKEYFFKIKAERVDTPTVTIVRKRDDVTITCEDGRGDPIQNNEVYPMNTFQIRLKGKIGGVSGEIWYPKEYSLMYDNGVAPQAEIDAQGRLTVKESAPIGSLIIVRVKCAFVEYAVIYRVEYPLSFDSRISDSEQLIYKIDYHVNCVEALNTVPGLQKIEYRVINRNDSSVLRAKTIPVVSFHSDMFIWNCQDLNYYDNIIFQGKLYISYYGSEFTIVLDDVEYQYQTTGSVTSFTATNRTRLVFDLSGYTSTGYRCVTIPANIKVLNIKGNGTPVRGLKFDLPANIIVNLYHTSLKGDVYDPVFNMTGTGGKMTLQVLGSCTIAGGDQSGSIPAASGIKGGSLEIILLNQGTLNLQGGKGNDGADGNDGKWMGDGANATAACAPGNPGKNGSYGNAGKSGGAGAAAITLSGKLTVSGTGTLNMTGGDGGNGGRGGDGGRGGKGGDGGGAGFFNVGGVGGSGGQGGNGGRGGDGGRGGNPYSCSGGVSVATGCNVLLKVGRCGSGGRGGNGGNGGIGGKGGPNTAIGNDGRGGNGGKGGNGGNGGNAYSVTFTDYLNRKLYSNGSVGSYGSYGAGGSGGNGGHDQPELKGASGTRGEYGSSGTRINVT